MSELKLAKPDGVLQTVAAGMATSVVSTLVTHPFDLVRARRHAAPRASPSSASPSSSATSSLAQQYGGDLRELGRIVARDGVRGLYRGAGTHFFGHVASAAAFYSAEAVFKRALWVPPERRQQQRRADRMLRRLAASTLAGFCQVCATHPLWVVKNRQQLAAGGPVARARNPLSALAALAATEGVRGLYAGLVPSLLLTVHTSVQYAAYDELKLAVARRRPDGRLHTIDRVLASIASKSVAVAISNPVLLVRTRLMEERSAYTGAAQAARTILREEGPRAFFRGTSAALWKVLAAGVTLPFFDAAISRTRKIFA